MMEQCVGLVHAWEFAVGVVLSLLAISCKCQERPVQRRPPVIIADPSPSLIVPEGSNSFSLRCTADGDLPIEYRWYKDETPLGLFSTSGSVYNMQAATRRDTGVYRCLARNSYGASFSSRSNVTVAYLGSFDSSGTNFQIQKSRSSFVKLTPPKLDAQPQSEIRWQWYHYDSVVFQNLTHYISSKGDLIILNVEGGHSGAYRVEATHTALPGRRISSQVFVVNVTNSFPTSSDPEIVLAPEDTVFYKSLDLNSFSLECVAHSRDLNSLQLVWKHNDSLVAPDGINFELQSNNRKLLLKNPNPVRQGGVYSCEASRTNLNVVQKQAWVAIFEAPVITQRMLAETPGALGQSVELACRSRGVPKPQVRWYKNAEDLTSQLECCPDNPPLRLDEDSGSLVISSVDKESSGIYQCEVSNSAGYALATTWLRTQADGPQFMVTPTNVSVAAGQEVRLPCSASGAPPPLISWKLNGSDVVPNGLTYRLDESSLVVPMASVQHSGWYTCIARNTEGQRTARAFLAVAGRTQITNGPVDQSVVIGSNVVFPCEVAQEAANSQFTRSWYFNGQLLTAGSSRNMELRGNGELFIRQVGPSKIGTYTCTVTSPLGTQSLSARLSIVEKPGMPLHVKAELVNQSLPIKIRISWTDGFDGNSPIIKYLVQSRVLGIQGLWSDWENNIENIGREQRSVVVDNLKPSATYEFRVIAANRFGPGIPSVKSNEVTMPQQPPAAAPRNVAGSARSASSIMVQWQPPPADQWNGDIMGYLVRYRLANYPDIPWLSRNISDSRSRNILLEDLITWREYEIQVSAYNERGMGVFSKSQYITTLEGVPSQAPSDVSVSVLNSTAVRIEFTPPPQQMIPGVNLGYKVEAWVGAPGTGNLAKQIQILPYSLQRIVRVIDGLRKFTAYNVTVLAYTAPGDGPRSESVEIRTKSDIPGPVVNMRFDEVLFSSVKVIWEPPAEPNGILEDYTLQYWVTGEKLATMKEMRIDPTETEYRVADLSASTRYSFDLWAATEDGRGPSQTATMESGVPPELPGPPTSLASSNIQARSVSLQFTPGYNGKTIITRWIVEGLVGTSTSWVLVYNVSSPNARSLEVTGLRPYMKYKLRLIAENVVGQSPPSPPTDEFQTLQDVPEGPPADITAEPESSDAVSVTWTPLPSYHWNGVPRGYVLYYRLNLGETNQLRGVVVANELSGNFLPGNLIPAEQAEVVNRGITDPAGSSYRVGDLHPYSVYDFWMESNNDLGRSQQSEVVKAKTYEGVPTAPPENVKATPDSDSRIRVSWSAVPPRHWQGRILGYRITYEERNPLTQSDVRKEVEVLGAGRRDHLIVGLRSFMEYGIQIRAFTIIGSGPSNQPPALVRTLEDTPGKPAEVKFPYVSDTQVRIEWKPPYRSNGVIRRYQVAYWDNATDPRTAIRMQLANQLFIFSANGLTRQRFYTFAVNAETSVGYGDEARLNVFTTASRVPPPAPGRPTQDASIKQESDHVAIKWQLADNPRAPVRLIDVDYQEANVGNWVRWEERVSGTQKFSVVKRLKPNKAYKFRLKSANDFGESSWSGESAWIKTREAAPSLPPNSIEAVPYDSNAIKLSWDAPDFESWHSDFVGYRVLYKDYYQTNDSFQIQEVPMTGSERKTLEMIVKNLLRFRHYILQLQTFNHQGSSSSSVPLFVYVGYSVPKTGVGNLRVKVKSSTQIDVEWDRWPNENEPVSGFKVRYLPTNAGLEVPWLEDIVKNGRNSVSLRDLYKFTEYSIVVAPFNKAGEGPERSTLATTMEDKPGPVGNLLFSDILLDSVNVSWTEPEEQNGVIVGYVVTYETFKEEIGTRQLVVKEWWREPGLFRLEFIKKIQEKVKRKFLLATNLVENVTYTFAVKAETAVGYGPPVIGKVKIGPQPGSPEAPAELRILPSDTFVSLEWKDRGHGSSRITAYIIQVKRVRNTRSESKRVKRRISKAPDHPLGKWVTLTTVEAGGRQHRISYNDLTPASVYLLRVFARNANGVSYPSPPSEEVVVPDAVDTPFYLQWWFLVILALVSLVIVVIVVALLCVTGRNNKYKYEKRNSIDSLQLADGGIVTYELRASQRANKNLQKHNHPYIRQSETGKTWLPTDGHGTTGSRGSRGGAAPPPAYGSVIRGPGSTGDVSKRGGVVQGAGNSLYDSLAVGTSLPVHPGSHKGSSHQLSHHGYTDKDVDTSTTGEEGSDSDGDDKDVSSIVQHYQTSDVAYRETWRRAKRGAAHASSKRPSSVSSQSENVSLNNHGATNLSQNPGSRQPIPGFSSFV